MMKISNHTLDVNRILLDIKQKNNDLRILRLSIIYLIYLYLKPLLDILFNYSPLIVHFGRFIGFFIVIQLIIDRDFLFFLLQKKYIIYLYLCATTVLLSMLLSSNSELSSMVSTLYNLGSCWMIYTIFIYLSISKENARVLLWIWVGLALINSLVGMYGSFTGQSLLGMTREDVGVGTFGYDPTTGRSGGLRGENYVGFWNAPILAFGFALLFERKHMVKIIGASFILLSILSIISSLSRISALAGIAVIIVSLALFFHFGKLWKAIILCFISVFIFISVQSLLIHQSQYFSTYVKYDMQKRWTISNAVRNVRLKIWREYLQVAAETPILGKGPGYIAQQVSRGKQVTHNSFLDVLVEHGIIGVFLYAIPFVLAFRSSLIYRKSKLLKDKYGRAACAIFWGMTVSLLFLSSPFLKLLWMLAGYLEGRTIFYTARFS